MILEGVILATIKNYFIEKSSLLNSVREKTNFMDAMQSIDWQQYRKSFMSLTIEMGGLEKLANEIDQSILALAYMHDQWELVLEENDIQKCNFHFAVYNALLDAMLKSGSGTSCENAIYVISTSDEYIFFRKVKKLRMLDQFLISKDGRSYDEIRAVDKNGIESTWYFDVTDVMQGY